MPSTRPWLLPCQCYSFPSWCSSESCWLLMLRPGPVDKNDGKPCETWQLTRRSATLTNIKPCPPPRIWSQDYHESKSRWISAKTRYCLMMYGILIIIYLALKMLCPFHFHLASIPCSHVKDSWKDPPEHQSTNTTRLSQVSKATGTPLGSIVFTLPKPGATNPRAKQQASAPSLPISFKPK